MRNEEYKPSVLTQILSWLDIVSYRITPKQRFLLHKLKIFLLLLATGNFMWFLLAVAGQVITGHHTTPEQVASWFVFIVGWSTGFWTWGNNGHCD